MAQIERLNHRHKQIINWMILNPDKTLGDCARAFNYTQAWLTQITHSDMFQAEYLEACKAANVLAVHTIVNELSGLTALTIEKTREKLEAGGASERFLGDTLSTCLASMGYSSRSVAKEQNPQLHVHVSAEALLEARERAAALKEGLVPPKVIDVSPAPKLPDPIDEIMVMLNGDACAA